MMMKQLMPVVLGCLLASACASAKAPAAEFPDALVEDVEKTDNGWTATVSGEVRLLVPDPDDTNRFQTVTLLAEHAVLRVPIGSQLYALGDSRAYETRLKEAVGTRHPIQIWGAIITVEAGRVRNIIGGDISLLRPRGRQAAFDIGRLPEITTR